MVSRHLPFVENYKLHFKIREDIIKREEEEGLTVMLDGVSVCLKISPSSLMSRTLFLIPLSSGDQDRIPLIISLKKFDSFVW